MIIFKIWLIQEAEEQVLSIQITPTIKNPSKKTIKDQVLVSSCKKIMYKNNNKNKSMSL